MKNVIVIVLLFISFHSMAQSNGASKPGSEEFANAIAAAQKGDYETCLEWFIKASDKGDAEAMYRIGLLYEYNGLLKAGGDQKKAIAWLKKSAAAGFMEAGKELERYNKEQNLVSLADWKTIHEGAVNAAKDYWVKVVDWDMIGDGRYYGIYAKQHNKKGKTLVPFAAAITFQIIDADGKVVKQLRTGGNDYGIAFAPYQDGKYTVQAYYDMNDCIGCRSQDKPGAFKMEYSITMYNYTEK